MTAPLATAEDLRDAAAFAALMWAMARPGTQHDLPQGMADLALALVDLECRVMTDDPALAGVIAATGAALVPADRADHAFCRNADGVLPVLAALPAGSALYPDRGATLVVAAQLDRGARLRLTGPGIDGACTVRAGGLPAGFFAARAARCRYPEGIDIVLVDGRRLMALPRSAGVEEL